MPVRSSIAPLRALSTPTWSARCTRGWYGRSWPSRPRSPSRRCSSCDPGVLLISRPAAILADAATCGLCLIARAPLAFRADGRWPGAEDVARAGSCSPAFLALHGPQDERDEYCQAISLLRAIRGSVPPVSRRSPGAVHSRQDDAAAIERRGLKGSAFHRGGDLRDERPLARITHQDVHGHCAGGTWRNIDQH